jgi:DNA-directed RNA polymerase specialized sigma24 family protein
MEAKELQRTQRMVRSQLAADGLQLEESLKTLARRKEALRETVQLAAAVGITEVEIAKLAGVARSTVREWLGKKT